MEAFSTSNTLNDGAEMFNAVCKLGLEGVVSKKLNAPYKSGPSKVWLKIKNPKAPAVRGRRTEFSKTILLQSVFRVPANGDV
jgi:ATP-dependent DNA ligase